MSCNGCRVLRKGCSDTCVIRSSVDWIQSGDSQGHAVVFVSKFFGRSDLLVFISAVAPNKRAALFQSLLFEACGRTVNPVNGAIGLLSTGNWHVCKAAVETVLAGGRICPLPTGVLPIDNHEGSDSFKESSLNIGNPKMIRERDYFSSASNNSTRFEISENSEIPKLLNLFH